MGACFSEEAVEGNRDGSVPEKGREAKGSSSEAVASASGRKSAMNDAVDPSSGTMATVTSETKQKAETTRKSYELPKKEVESVSRKSFVSS